MLRLAVTSSRLTVCGICAESFSTRATNGVAMQSKVRDAPSRALAVRAYSQITQVMTEDQVCPNALWKAASRFGIGETCFAWCGLAATSLAFLAAALGGLESQTSPLAARAERGGDLPLGRTATVPEEVSPPGAVRHRPDRPRRILGTNVSPRPEAGAILSILTPPTSKGWDVSPLGRYWFLACQRYTRALAAPVFSTRCPAAIASFAKGRSTERA